MTQIQIKNLSFSYDKQKILEDINLSVEKNDFLAIIGPNGGGKSTLLKILTGLLQYKTGDININNHDSNQPLQIGYVPQNTNINTDFPIKVIEVVLMGHMSPKNKQPKKQSFLNKYFNIGYNELEISCAMNALKQVGMENFANYKIGSLSGGQRQRVMIARALCTHPNILLLDEPTASIDVSGQKQIYNLLKELNKTITIVVVSHDISIILGYANKVAHINKTLTYHDISHRKNSINNSDEHFCEVEMLELLGDSKGCKC